MKRVNGDNSSIMEQILGESEQENLQKKQPILSKNTYLQSDLIFKNYAELDMELLNNKDK